MLSLLKDGIKKKKAASVEAHGLVWLIR